MKRISFVIISLFALAFINAQTLEFDPNTKYRIGNLYYTPSAVALGENHDINSPLCVAISNYTDSDCYWYIKEEKTGQFSIRNASTNQYITHDDSYASSPQYLRYIHMSSELEGDESLWVIGQMTGTSYGTQAFYFQSVASTSCYFHMRTGSSSMRVLGGYNSSPDNGTFLFEFYTSDGKAYNPITSTDPIDPVVPVDTVIPEPDAPEPVVIDSSLVLQPISNNNLYIYRADGKVDIIPQEYITNRMETPTAIVINTIADTTYYYQRYLVDSITTKSPVIPTFNSFKFNNKFNHHIISDAQGVFMNDTSIVLNVIGIGKTLTPSFKVDTDVAVYIYNTPQESKKTRVRFANDVVYTVARRGQTILRRNLNGDFVVRPYGRDINVHVDFATDHYTTSNRVPVVYITTDNGTSINSKSYWWTGKIRIDGAGVFPDMETTPMQIKGRGNTSWTSTGKAPYHMKFDEALKPFGLTKGKHWNFIANALTHSMECNPIAMKMAQLVETAGFNHMIPCELYINGEYRGSYTFTEKVGFANNSIDLTNEQYSAMYELDLYYDETYKFRTGYYGLPVNIKEPDFSDTENPTPLTLSDVKLPMERAMESLYEQNEVEYNFDLDYLAKFLFVDDYTANGELFHPKSTFCYAQNILDSSSPLVFGPCWDFDWCFAGPGPYFENKATNDFWSKSDGSGNAWAKAMRYNPGEKFDAKYYRLWHDFNQNKLGELIDFVEDYYNYVKYSYTHDHEKWKRGDAEAYYQIKELAKTWLYERAHYIENYMANTLGYASKGYLDTSKEIPPMGDANGDGHVTTADLVCVLNYIFGLPTEDFDFAQADTNGDDIITIADMQKIRQLIGTVASNGFYGLPEADAAVAASPVTYGNEIVTIPLNITVAEGDYSGMQFDINIPVGMTIEDLDVFSTIPDFNISVEPIDSPSASDGKQDFYRVSIYGSGNCKLPQGTTTVNLQLGWGFADRQPGALAVNLSNVMFVNTLAEDFRAGSASAQFVADEISGINDALSLSQQNGTQLTFRATQPTTLPVYTVDGRIFRVYNISGTETISLPRGIYIINKQKVCVK